jgi:hypothetical protein
MTVVKTDDVLGLTQTLGNLEGIELKTHSGLLVDIAQRPEIGCAGQQEAHAFVRKVALGLVVESLDPVFGSAKFCHFNFLLQHLSGNL